MAGKKSQQEMVQVGVFLLFRHDNGHFDVCFKERLLTGA